MFRRGELLALFTIKSIFVAWLLLVNHAFADSSVRLFEPAQRSTEWMFRGKVGISTHYFAHTRDELGGLVNQLKFEEIADQASAAGAGWFLFTLFHRPWIMMAPNATYDRLLGVDGFTATTDVPNELSKVLGKKNIRLMLYVNLRLGPESRADPRVLQALGGWPPNDVLVKNIAAVFREFSLRYGSRVAGWWVDEVQMKSEWGRSDRRERWFKEIADALRAGNPNALVAFNPGFSQTRYSAQNDYLAGENRELPSVPTERFVDGAQWHSWTYLGNTWGSGGTRFENKYLIEYGKEVKTKGGVLTFDVGLKGVTRAGHKDAGVWNPDDFGRIDPLQVQQIRSLSQAIRGPN